MAQAVKTLSTKPAVMSVPVPDVKPLDAILPREPILLMGAGPVPIPHAVARANGVVINHMGDTMEVVVTELKRMVRYAFQTRADKVMGVAGPRLCCHGNGDCQSLCGAAGAVLCLKTGIFSHRLGEMAQAVGAEVTFVEPETGKPVTADMARRALSSGRYDVVTLAQGETSCGVLNSELVEIARVAREYGALTVVDAVVTLSTMPIEMDAWGLDTVVTGGQKGLSSIPRRVARRVLGPRLGHDSIAAGAAPPTGVSTPFAPSGFWGDHQYHYTAPVPGILALYEALRLVCEEGLEARTARSVTRVSSRSRFRRGSKRWVSSSSCPSRTRLNSVVAVRNPPNVNSKEVLSFMSRKFCVEISGSFGLDVVRIGQMGEQCRSQNLFKVLYATGMSFRHFGVGLNVSEGLAALERALTREHEFE